MKMIKKAIGSKTDMLFIIIYLMMAFSIVGCQSNIPKDSENLVDIGIQKDFLVVERHQVFLDWNFSVTADLPITNYMHLERDARYLSDSVSSLINKELHSLLDNLSMERSEEEKESYYHQTMTSSDGPIYDLDIIKDEYESLKEEYVGGQWISFILVAQTESFVTYGLECYHCAGSCGSEFYCYTFSKKDGHRVKNLITWKDIMRFINDHPDAYHPFGQWQLEAKFDDMNASHLYDAGLLNDGLLLVNEDDVNHYVIGKIAYKDILPYLSKEAQELVKVMGDGVKYNREGWYLGRCIGECKTNEDTNIHLMQREPLWQSFSNLNYSGEDSLFENNTFSLTAYEESGDIFKPVKIFKRKTENDAKARIEFVLPKGSWEGPSFDDEFFTLDEKILYVPYLKDNNIVDITAFKFDGYLFKEANPKDTKPQGEIVGKFVSNAKDSICLVRILDESVPVLEGFSAYYIRNGLYYPAKIFPYYEPQMSSHLGDEPYVSSHSKGRGYVFEPKTKDVYAIKLERTSMGGYGCFDRYRVFRFNGQHYFFDKEDGGFWLHPSVRVFKGLIYLGKSKNYLVRIDDMKFYDWRSMNEEDYEASKNDTCRYRYASWKNKDNMESAPNVVIGNGYWNHEKDCFVFENDGYIYEVHRNFFEVYHGNKKILEQKLRVLTSASDD